MLALVVVAAPSTAAAVRTAARVRVTSLCVECVIVCPLRLPLPGIFPAALAHRRSAVRRGPALHVQPCTRSKPHNVRPSTLPAAGGKSARKAGQSCSIKTENDIAFRRFDAAPTRPPSLRCAPLQAATLPLRGGDGASGGEPASHRAHSLRCTGRLAAACTLLLSLPRRGRVAERSEAGWGIGDVTAV